MDKFDNSKKNLKDIKSAYILKKIFSLLYKKQALKIIMYNKELQEILAVDIQDYKNVSEIYKIGGKNGKGREYLLNTNNLIFEGEYLNGRKNGKGKEYSINGELSFEGDY
jgi:hypothetical protein